MKGAVDWAGVAVLGIAAVAVTASHGPRSAAARWYADASRYNRSITEFLRDHRAELAGRDVAVLGVTGHSPWSNTAGAYLSRIVGANVAWTVYVPGEDVFYRVGRLPRSSIDVRPESALACDAKARNGDVYVTIDSRGRGTIDSDCAQALQRAHPTPVITGWRPTSVTSRQALGGFDLEIRGEYLSAGTVVAVAGKPLPMVRAPHGALMTTRIPANAHVDGVVRFSVEHRGTPVLQGRVEVLDERRAPGGG